MDLVGCVYRFICMHVTTIIKEKRQWRSYMKAEGGLGARESGAVGPGIVTGDEVMNMLFPGMKCHNKASQSVQFINAEIKKKQVNKIHSIAS